MPTGQSSDRFSAAKVRDLRGGLTASALEPLVTPDFVDRHALVVDGLRERHGPVAAVDLLGVPVWLVLGYREVLDVLHNRNRTWSKDIRHWRARAEGRVPRDWPLLVPHESDGVLFQEGARHSERRGAWLAALPPFQDATHQHARDLQERCRGYADELVDLFADGATTGDVDLAAQYARPLMLMLCQEMIGVESVTEELLLDVWRTMDMGPDSAAALGRVTAQVTAAVAAKRSAPGDDLPSLMIEAAGPSLTDEQIAGDMTALVIHLGDMAAALVCTTVLEVVSGDSGARAALAGGLVREAVNRAILAEPPNSHLSLRYATADTVLGGVTVAAGDPVLLSVSGAHRDPSFAGARQPSGVFSSRAHLAWGAGAHRCPGADLAMTLVTIAVERLFDRLAALELAVPPEELPWRRSPAVRALHALPVRFRLHPTAPAAPRAEPVAEETPAERKPRRSVSRGLLGRLVRAMRRDTPD
ncbi:cytochrome P450 [Actinocorallia sp. A-T 12471]|uniref:cytochrome P450 n=1 Tax=Actinocorallia sp. A-T 12471 TaxID=3089813 RepID=UPI0029CDA733|nr:cytochrome P450 [Actinocorallia sp. A-T 12471]MDX6740781.1 cytochrome P450 [Actinocorallia sp. A-T 12471]